MRGPFFISGRNFIQTGYLNDFKLMAWMILLGALITDFREAVRRT